LRRKYRLAERSCRARLERLHQNRTGPDTGRSCIGPMAARARSVPARNLTSGRVRRGRRSVWQRQTRGIGSRRRLDRHFVCPSRTGRVGRNPDPSLVARADHAMKLTVHTPTLALLLLASFGPFGAQAVSTHGPARGSLVLQGGVGLNRAIASAFVARAGGPESHIVVIPTASVGDAVPPRMAPSLARRMKESWGVAAVTVLHTIDRADADADRFIEPLRRGTGVWMLGGFPENLVHAYLGTKTERAIKELLERGGVVGGESAGAMIQGSWLDTTDSEWTP